MKKSMIVGAIAMLFVAMSTIPVYAFDAMPEEITHSVSVKGTLLSNDLTKRVKVDEKNLTPHLDFSSLENSDITESIEPLINHPSTLLIWSVKATPYARDKSTGILYNFIDFIIGNDTYFPTNNMVLTFSPEQLTSYENILSDNGYDLIGWEMNMTYEPNTRQIPRRLSITDNTGNEIDYVTLSSADWNTRKVYSQSFYHFPGGQYYGEILGHLVATNLDGSAQLFPFEAAMYFE